MRAHLTHSRDRLRRAQEIAESESEPKFSER
jgi:hypothetical protein